MKIIQQYPIALPQALVLRDEGDNPRVLADHVQGVYELDEHYFAQSQQISFADTDVPITTADSGPTLTVPQGEYWRVQNVTGNVFPSGTGAIVGFTTFLQRPPIAPASRYVVFANYLPRATLAGEVRCDLGFQVPKPFIAMPGTLFQCATTVPPGGALDLYMQIRVMYNLLRV